FRGFDVDLRFGFYLTPVVGVVMMVVVVVAVTLRLFGTLLWGGLFGENGSLEGIGWFTGLGKLLIIGRNGTGWGGGVVLVFATFDLDLREGLDVDIDATLVVRFGVVVHVVERDSRVGTDGESSTVLGDRRALRDFRLLIFGGRAGRGRRR